MEVTPMEVTRTQRCIDRVLFVLAGVILGSLTGCAALTGDFVLDRPLQGVGVRHEHLGARHAYRPVGSMSTTTALFAINAGRSTLYVANGESYPILVDVACGGQGGELGYRIEPGHEQGFAEWDGNECSLTSARSAPK
jgi:hypothetical protein